MRREQPRPAADASEEISALIEVLHRTGQRLEELTGGEVDAVADRDGRTFVLRQAQEQLRQSETTRQAAILNVLPANIALLDTRSVVVSVNAAWREFAGANAFHGADLGIGCNYLEICDAAQGADAAEAQAVAAGLRALLAGERASFSIEYPCHAPTERRWFLMVATSLPGPHPNGIVVMHLNITQRKLVEQDLRESERRFTAMLENVQLVSVMLDRDARITYCNDYLLRLCGWSLPEVIGRHWFELFVPPEANVTREAFVDLLANLPATWHHENEILTRSGQRRLIRWSNSVLRSGAGEVIGTASIGEDISERRKAEARIVYLNRVHAMLSGINTLIVRVRDRDELFREACRIAVEAGGFRMVWIGGIDQSTNKIVPLASAGVDAEMLSTIKERFSLNEDLPFGNTMTAQAIRDKTAVVSNDSQNDSRLVFPVQHAQAGIRSFAILPVLIADQVVGVFALYASEVNFFQDEELKLIHELAGDIAFAMDHIDKQERLDYLSYYDVLTGLANRSLFLERVALYMHSAVSGGHQMAVILIDLERFKSINDSLGRPAGDALLRQVARWLTHSAGGDASMLARVGADLFAAILPVLRQDGDVVRLIEKSIAAIADHPFHLNDAVFRVAAKLGVALFPQDGADADTLFRNAEAAVKRAKASGERYLFYTQTMTATAAASLSLENLLRQALDNHEFVLHYQPKVNLVSGKLVGAEALIRWNDPRTGLVPPIRFIPVLEEIGLIHDVG
ncbi:MAG: diguanylate cyclase, partial [Burkholderiaceae bacterium]|nr:diguanylate cyclase [Burkholderiaceae bacterium]